MAEPDRLDEALNLTEEVRDGILTHTGPQEPATLVSGDPVGDKAELPQQVALLGDRGSRRIDTLVHDQYWKLSERGVRCAGWQSPQKSLLSLHFCARSVLPT